MHTYSFIIRGINKLIIKKYKYNCAVFKINFYGVLRFNKKNSKLLFYKLKCRNKPQSSISNQINVCLLTGKHRSVLGEYKQKRHVFLKSLTENKLSFLKKK